MTTDELLIKLPSHIGRYKDGDFYISFEEHDIGWLTLFNDGKDWCAAYRDDYDGCCVCMNPKAEQPPYNNALCYGNTPQEALQNLYDWCIKNGFINEF